MRASLRRLRLPALVAGLAAIVMLTLSGSAVAATSGASTASPAIQGTIKGFSSGDFTFLDALSVPSLTLNQASIAQSAAGVSNTSMQTTDTLGQNLLTSKSATGHNAYASSAGVSLNLGQADETVPQVQLTRAEVVGPPRNSATTDVVKLPLSPVASLDVQPDSAVVNTTSDDDFCVLGAPLSEGTSTIANAAVLPLSSSVALAAANGTVRDDSTEELDPNGAGSLGLNSVATLNTAGITLFQGIPGAEVTIKVINPLILQAFAGGVSGSAKVTYGSGDGTTDVLSITAGSKTVKLTANQVFGGAGVVIPVGSQSVHLLNITIGGQPSMTLAPNGTTASAVADLVSVQIVNAGGPTSTTIGGPLGPIVTPVLGSVVTALDGLVGQLQTSIQQLGLKKGVDLRIGHFEANAQVPSGGVKCGLPVTKTTDKDPVAPGEQFTITIRADNPYDCVAKDVRVDDTISATNGVTWTVGATRPQADKVTHTEVVWDDVGSIQPGGHRDVEVDITIGPDSDVGHMSDVANVTATCGTGNGPGQSTMDLAGDYTLHAPYVSPTISAAGSTLPDTGMSAMVPIGGALLFAAGLGIAVIRRRVS